MPKNKAPDLKDIIQVCLQDGVTISELIWILVDEIRLDRSIKDKAERNFLIDFSMIHFAQAIEKQMNHCGRPVLTRVVKDVKKNKVGLQVNCASCLHEETYWEKQF